MIIAFARINVGADFGDRTPGGFVTEYGLVSASRAAGAPVLNDIHGLMVYPSDPKPFFLRFGAVSVRASSPHGRLAEALKSAVEDDVRLSGSQRLAYDRVRSEPVRCAFEPHWGHSLRPGQLAPHQAKRSCESILTRSAVSVCVRPSTAVGVDAP